MTHDEIEDLMLVETSRGLIGMLRSDPANLSKAFLAVSDVNLGKGVKRLFLATPLLYQTITQMNATHAKLADMIAKTPDSEVKKSLQAIFYRLQTVGKESQLIARIGLEAALKNPSDS